MLERSVRQAAVERVLLIASALISSAIFLWVLYFSRYGLDLTDEGFYLNSIRSPSAYNINIPPSQFGFVYHWLHHLLDGDIAKLRLVNVSFTGLLAWGLSLQVLLRCWSRDAGNRALLVVAAAAVSTLSLVVFSLWLLTPNYNGLAFQALMLVMIGVLDVDGRRAPALSWGWALIGIGGWLCFMAKPTTAIAIAVLVACYVLVFARKSVLPMLAAALGAICLVVLSAWLMDGSVAAFILRLSRSAEINVLLGSGQELSKIFRFDTLEPGRSQVMLTILVGLLSPALIFVFKQRSEMSVSAVLLALTLATAAYVTLAIGVGDDSFRLDRAGVFLLPCAVVIGSTLYLGRDMLIGLSWRRLSLALMFLLLPHAYVFGSNGNYWVNGSNAALFWMLSALILLAPLSRLRNGIGLLPLALLAQLMATAMMNGGIQTPYRQETVLRDDATTTVFPGQGSLILSQALHDYIAAAEVGARTAGFQAGSPAIDLTGRSPGILYAIDAHSLGLAWMPGGYPGSVEVAHAALAMESCEDLADAWLLEEPGGPNSVSEADVLAGFGASRDQDYSVAASFRTAPQSGGYAEPYQQNLLMPIRSRPDAIAACRVARDDMLNRQMGTIQ